MVVVSSARTQRSAWMSTNLTNSKLYVLTWQDKDFTSCISKIFLNLTPVFLLVCRWLSVPVFCDPLQFSWHIPVIPGSGGGLWASCGGGGTRSVRSALSGGY